MADHNERPENTAGGPWPTEQEPPLSSGDRWLVRIGTFIGQGSSRCLRRLLDC